MSSSLGPEMLLDVTRLLWRLWSGRLPTGIDRVCLEYVRQFGARSNAVVQFRGRIFVLSNGDSQRLFALMIEARRSFRGGLAAIAPGAFLRARTTPPRRGMLYLNVGHTGLNMPELPQWIAKNGVRAVYLIHDLIPITHAQFCRAGEADKHRERMRNALASASGIIGNSQATIDDLAAFAADEGLSMPPSTVAWLSGTEIPQSVAPRVLDRPHFVALGTIEARKNHALLLTVWESLVAEMGEKAPVLLVIGQRGWEADDVIAKLDDPGVLQGHVRELGRCDDDALAGWLAGARALLMPSFAEGFGLPVIEALELGTPVIATDLPVYREIVGDLPTYLGGKDSDVWERAVRDFVTDSAERKRQIAAMRGYRPPDWPGHFRSVESWLAELSPPCNNRAVV